MRSFIDFPLLPRATIPRSSNNADRLIAFANVLRDVLDQGVRLRRAEQPPLRSRANFMSYCEEVKPARPILGLSPANRCL